MTLPKWIIQVIFTKQNVFSCETFTTYYQSLKCQENNLKVGFLSKVAIILYLIPLSPFSSFKYLADLW